ncbi:hypothetical protein MMAD_12380 [Mycolicibacterium madagascariense]|uniref:HNH nuclease domain-containing protein n=1 Tax=Mycolicibacterium madagascariense TaxID=212765 RepID=A0A7I7XDD6_9MYCO|nr:HNH endonuclease signature motif containing protein [Mycolicibacterium madagascariense]MCV7013497.1 DUF222 domain-containing protein [Mycolicibacterium madagascariense]BBZ26943.1 hypothetical protein MMAD_12380 [Mycolicibacterium madagascariense]
MFDTLVTTALCAQGPVAVELWTRVENAACAHRLHAMRTMLEAAMSADGSVDRDQWCIDNWSAVCAHIGAAQRLTTRSVSATLLVALALRERFPRLEALFTDGRLSYPIVRLITTRASAVIDPAVWEALDIALSERFTSTDYPTSLYRAQKAVDAEIWRLDPAAVHRTQTRAQGRRVDVTIDDETGIAQLYASLFATDGAAFTTRLDALADTVCPQDPRTKDQLRSEAIGALSYGQDRLACLCERPDCEAFLRPPSTGVVIHLIAHPDTITGNGFSDLPPVVPPVDGARGDVLADSEVEPEREDETDDVPQADVEPEDAAVDVDTDDAFAEPNWAMETEPTTADPRAEASADASTGQDDDTDATVDADTDSASTEPKPAEETEPAATNTHPRSDAPTNAGDDDSVAELTATDGVTDTDDVATDTTVDDVATDTTVDDTADVDLDGDAATDAANDTTAETNNAPAATELTNPNPTTDPDLAPRAPIPFITPEQECAGLDGTPPPLYDKPLTQLTWAELFHPRPHPQRLSALPTATLLSGGVLSGTVLPGAIARRAATGATISVIVHPGQAPPEPHYRPSPTLADFIRCRDQTCRYPGCTKPASTADIDHTIPYPYGPTAASNLKCLCREHHLLKTFYNGWHDRQLPDGTVIWTTPDGRTHTTQPGSHTDYPHLCAPTAPITAHPPPPQPANELKMPTRRATRRHDRRQRALTERQANRRALETDHPTTPSAKYQAAQHDSDPPPF